MDLNDCAFYEWPSSSSPIKIQGTYHILFKGEQKESFSLYFFIKDGHAYEFFTKTDISEFIGPAGSISRDSFRNMWHSDTPYELIPESFAEKTRKITEDRKKEERYVSFFKNGLIRARNERAIRKREAERTKQENDRNLGWLKENL